MVVWYAKISFIYSALLTLLQEAYNSSTSSPEFSNMVMKVISAVCVGAFFVLAYLYTLLTLQSLLVSLAYAQAAS